MLTYEVLVRQTCTSSGQKLITLLLHWDTRFWPTDSCVQTLVSCKANISCKQICKEPTLTLLHPNSPLLDSRTAC